jgi:hypothetical protein
MVKHSVSLMGQFFTRERFGTPQAYAALLLLAFAAQCIWLVNRSISSGLPFSTEIARIETGRSQWRGNGVVKSSPSTGEEDAQQSEVYDPNHSPLWYLIPAFPVWVWAHAGENHVFATWIWLGRAPYVVFGMLLGASLWYVARRLYGNQGGYVAMVLYCFSPGIIRSSALWSAQPEMGAAWGAFGAIFTAIAVAHTLYAPREVVLWNWRRILLLGLSLTLAVGSQFSLWLLIPVALAFTLYLAPTRRGAALAIWIAACVVGFVLLFAAYFFHPGMMLQSLRQAHWLKLSWQAAGMSGAYQELIVHLAQISPALLILFPIAVLVYATWPRARYFGNTAPLLVSALLLVLALLNPHYPGFGFTLVAVPFLLVFIAGVTSDLLETKYHHLVWACVWGLILGVAFWNLTSLIRAGRG